MSILIKHGDPGILVGLADAAGQLAGAGRVRDQVFQANLGDQSNRRAASTQFQNASGLEAQRQAGQIAAQNNAAAIRQREIASVERLSGRRSREEESDPYTGGMVRSPRGRSVRSSIPADAGYLDDMALKAATLAERQRAALADEEQARAELAQREADSRRRLDQADMRIGQGQQRVEQGQARVEQGQQRVEQGAARVQQGDRRLTETERRNLSTEQIRREQLDAADAKAAARAKSAPTRPRSYALRIGNNKKNVYAREMASILGNDMALVAESMMPLFADLDPINRTTTTPTQMAAIRGHDAALRLIGQSTDENGKKELSLPAMQEVVERAASLLEDAKVAEWAKRYVPVLEKQRNEIVREVVSTYERVADIIKNGTDADAADAIERAAEAAGMTEQDYVDSVEFLMGQGLIERPTVQDPAMGAGPPPEQTDVGAVAAATEPDLYEVDPETGQVYVRGSATESRRRERPD